MLSVRGISKSFGSVQALSGVDADFAAGEIHAVVGENGAGKSTLMNLLAGFLEPDSGSMTLDGAPVRFRHPLAARQAGIELVHQHFMLVPNFSIEENLALMQVASSLQPFDSAMLAGRALAVAKELRWEFPSARRTVDLPVGIQQRLEIVKALSGTSRVLILDEPTAVLGPDEVIDLFRVLRTLASQGKAVILIAHKLSEVFAVSNRVTVLRKGKLIGTRAIDKITPDQLAHWMVGEMPPVAAKEAVELGSVVCEATMLSARGDRGEVAVREVDLAIRSGEILGIGGVDGNGQIELAESLARVRPIVSGQLEVAEDAVYIPQDRQRDGLALRMSIQDNLLIGRHYHGSFWSRRAITAWTTAIVERFGIKIGSLDDEARTLSGGNQQKIVVGRSLASRPNFLIAVNPTRGLDVSAASFIHQCLLKARAAGSAIVLFSTDLDELTALSDRVLFMSRGQLSASFLGEPR